MDYGLLGGIAEGLKSGVEAYGQASERKSRIDALRIKQMVDEEQRLKQERELGEKKDEDKKRRKQDLQIQGYEEDPATGLLRDIPGSRGLLKRELETKKIKDDLSKKPTDTSIKAATELRKEFQGRPGVKDFNTVSTAYKKVQAASQDPSAAGDLSLIFAYMKMLDPGSTVREGEFANAQNAAGVPDQIINMYNRAKTGERLNPNQRADFINQAGKIYSSQEAQLEEIENEFSGLSERYGVDKGLIFQPREKNKGLVAPQGKSKEDLIKELKALEGK